jgi:hypothetical protein
MLVERGVGGFSLEVAASRGFLVGDLFSPRSDELWWWPFTVLVLGMILALAVAFDSSFGCDTFSSCMVSTDTGLPALDFHFPVPEFLSVRGGEGGPLLEGPDGFAEDNLSLDALRSVAGGVKMFS